MLGSGERGARVASRIAGRGALLRSLRQLRQRVARFGEHRAATSDERRWAATLFDGLAATLDRALDSDAARASLAARDRRTAVRRKTPAPQDMR